jgi:hypothetical protein
VNLGARLADLIQLSYITRDLEAAIEHARDKLGIASFHVSEQTVPVLSYGSVQELTVRAAIANVGRHQFEYIQPVSGPIHVYTDHVDIEANLLAFHHVAIAVRGGHDEWLKLLDEVRASGDAFAFLFPPEPDPSVKVAFCYVDTRHRLGHFTEYLWWDKSLDGQPSFPNLEA